MQNNKKTITPNEINKFTYCPYQWYYERYYGNALLRQLVKERNQALGFKNSATIKNKNSATIKNSTALSNFVSGNRHHAQIHSQYKKNQIIIKLLILLFLVAFLLFVLEFKSTIG